MGDRVRKPDRQTAGTPKPRPRRPAFETDVILGKKLSALTRGVENLHPRDCLAPLENYLYGPERDRVCVLFGLRETGKTTLMLQAVRGMTPEDFRRAAWIRLRGDDSMGMVNRDLGKLRDAGFRYVFLDEVTRMRDFIDMASLFSDIYAAMGMKIVLSGDESLGFWLAMNQELYDRARAVHTTFLPYRECSRLPGIESIEEEIRRGGTLRTGEDAPFRDGESARRYLDTAVCENIRHSLACCDEGRHLRTLLHAGTLTAAISLVLEGMNRRFLRSVLTDRFLSPDPREENGPEGCAGEPAGPAGESVVPRLAALLEDRGGEAASSGVTGTQIREIRECLTALDLIADCPVETVEPGTVPAERVLFTQPGLRYCQAQALVHSLLKDEAFSRLGEPEKARTADGILEAVRERILSDIVLLEALKSADRWHRVFTLRFAAGGFDMVIYDEKEECCEIFEIRHSGRCLPAQSRHLTDRDRCEKTARRFGPIRARVVLYRGEDADGENGVRYRNVERYLKSLPDPVRTGHSA